MKILLLGSTGNLGTRCLQSLIAHKHIVILLVRHPSKLPLLFHASLLTRVSAIVVGDATDALTLEKTMIEHEIEGVVNVAGNQVLPWKEQVLPRIARAVTDAARRAGRERGTVLRAWLVSGFNVLEYPGTGGRLITEYGGFNILRKAAMPHIGTRDVVEAVPLSELRWSLICVGWMYPAEPQQKMLDLLEEPRGHNLALEAGAPPGWESTWLARVPFIGLGLDLWYQMFCQYATVLEDVADLLAGDMASGSEQWVGVKVGMKDKKKMKTA